MRRNSFNELKRVFDALNGPGGCPWDKKQTHKSLLADLREEVGEYIAAVKSGNTAHMREEIGDILLHVMFSAQIAKTKNLFTIDDVIDELVRKLKRRHPHVFGTAKVRSAKEVIANWHKIKRQEKREKARVRA